MTTSSQDLDLENVCTSHHCVLLQARNIGTDNSLHRDINTCRERASLVAANAWKGCLAVLAFTKLKTAFRPCRCDLVLVCMPQASGHPTEDYAH